MKDDEKPEKPLRLVTPGEKPARKRKARISKPQSIALRRRWVNVQTALSMRVMGATYEEIAAELCVSKSRVAQIIKQELEGAAELTRDLGVLLFQEAAERERVVVREAAEIALRRCLPCDGTGRMIPVPEMPPATLLQAVDPATCVACYGTGYRYRARDRLEALATIQKSDEQLAKMFGFYAPERFLHLHEHQLAPFMREVLSVPDDELERELEAFAQRQLPVVEQ